MSRFINTYELSGHQQDILWSDTCPYCSSTIVESQKTIEDAYWKCGYCDIIFICE